MFCLFPLAEFLEEVEGCFFFRVMHMNPGYWLQHGPNNCSSFYILQLLGFPLAHIFLRLLQGLILLSGVTSVWVRP